MSGGDLRVRVNSIRAEAQNIKSFELIPLNGDVLPPFTAGAHIDLHLDNGLVRSYSLVNPQEERHRYVVAVNRDAASRGGSTYLHDRMQPGTDLTISAPRNTFPLVEDATTVVLLAGGIGITPLWCMIQRLEQLGRHWQLHYAARSRKAAAFVDQLTTLGDGARRRVHLSFDDETGGQLLDLKAIVSAASDDAHLYCCGPAPMLAAFEAACSGRDRRYIHTERFSPVAPSGAGFRVVLARTQKEFWVPPGKTILDTLLEKGIDVLHSCTQGVCGTCQTSVIEGVPDHCDSVLTEAEKQSNKVMMICCSGSKTERLVLDL